MFNDLYGAYGAESIVETTMYSGALLGMFLGIIIFSAIISLIIIISYWKVFKKAGQPGWAAIVPIYNMVVMIQIAKLPIWYIVLFFIPIANIYAIFKIYIEIAKKFGKSSGFGIGMALIPVIFIPMLAFSDNVYEDKKEQSISNNNGFDAASVINNNQTNVENVELQSNIVPEVNNIQTNDSIQVESQNIEIDNTSLVGVNNTVINDDSNEVPSMENVNTVEQVSTFGAPMMEQNNVVEPVNDSVVTPIQDAFNSTPEAEQPVIPVVPVEPVIAPTQNAFDSTPVNNISEANVLEQSVASANTVEPVIAPTQNAFDSTPVNNTPGDIMIEQAAIVQENIENLQEPVVIEPVQTESISIEQKKLCKNCGTEMPEIVSICPNCGTDNE